MMGYGFGFGGIFMILFWGLVIWAIITLVKGVSTGNECCNQGHCKENRSDAVDILRKRYAKGEITKEEFESMKKDLQ